MPLKLLKENEGIRGRENESGILRKEHWKEDRSSIDGGPDQGKEIKSWSASIFSL